MPTSANHDIPTPTVTDLAAVPAHMKAMADKIDSELDSIAPGQIIGVGAGEVLIANSSGVLTPQEIDGDATINEAGALTLSDEAVNTLELADSAVATDKILNGAVTGAKIGGGTIGLTKTKMRSGTVDVINLSTGTSTVPNAEYAFADFGHGLGHTNYIAVVSAELGLVTLETSWNKGKTIDLMGALDPENIISIRVRNLTGSTQGPVKVSVLVVDLT